MLITASPSSSYFVFNVHSISLPRMPRRLSPSLHLSIYGCFYRAVSTTLSLASTVRFPNLTSIPLPFSPPSPLIPPLSSPLQLPSASLIASSSSRNPAAPTARSRDRAAKSTRPPRDAPGRVHTRVYRLAATRGECTEADGTGQIAVLGRVSGRGGELLNRGRRATDHGQGTLGRTPLKIL